MMYDKFKFKKEMEEVFFKHYCGELGSMIGRSEHIRE